MNSAAVKVIVVVLTIWSLFIAGLLMVIPEEALNLDIKPVLDPISDYSYSRQ